MKAYDEELLQLEALVIDDSDFQDLELLLDEFNIFEAIGAVRQELRHSDFLAYLLDPLQKHGLETLFVKGVLQRSLSGVGYSDFPVTAIDIDLWNLDDLEISREWQNIDLLLVSNRNKLVIAIENKVTTSEHSNQLERYVQTVEQHYSEYHRVYIYLSSEGDEASDSRYLSLSYGNICELLETLSNSRASIIGQDIHTLINHYTRMVRRHILSDSPIEELAQRIYRKHQRALDLIFEHRPDDQKELYGFLLNLVENTPDFILDHSTKSNIRFLPQQWDVPFLSQGEGWTPSKRMLLLEFENHRTSLKLKLVIGPGPKEVRQCLLDLAKTNEPPFKSAYKSLNIKWNNILSRSILTPKDYEERTLEEHQQKINKFWDRFLKTDLPEMIAIVQRQEWFGSS